MKIIIGNIINIAENKECLFEHDDIKDLSIEIIDNANIRYSISAENNTIVFRVISGSRRLKLKPVASNSIEINSEY